MAAISQGTIYKQKGTKNWSIRFQLDGKEHRESAGTDNQQQALAYLRRRVDEAKRGVFVEASQRVTFDQLHRLLLDDYKFKRNRTRPSRHVRRLAEFFGGLNADEITEKRILAYSAWGGR